MTEPKRRGRPEGREYPHSRTLLLADEDNEALNALAGKWGCSAAAAVRRLIRERAEELGIARPDRGAAEG